LLFMPRHSQSNRRLESCWRKVAMLFKNNPTLGGVDNLVIPPKQLSAKNFPQRFIIKFHRSQ
ncbi:hypothetical protein, partial [Enterobacter asburiae]|uniref:hypothetical protein n=1 Tax=Enterobacter asburiae TaxID=61645 RepID=UPI00195302C7